MYTSHISQPLFPPPSLLVSHPILHAVGAVLALKTFDNVKETTPALEDLLKAAAKQVFLGHLFPLLPNSIVRSCVALPVQHGRCTAHRQNGRVHCSARLRGRGKRVGCALIPASCNPNPYLCYIERSLLVSFTLFSVFCLRTGRKNQGT